MLSVVTYGQDADLLLTNGSIITLREPGDRAQAVAIKDGLILAAGDTASMLRFIGPHTTVIDLHGQTVTPGFNDVHQHPSPIYSWDKPYASLELDTVTSMKSLLDLLRRKAAITPRGMLIKGVAYNEAKLGAQPIRDSLDLASTDHPILISHASGHLVAANSYLLRANNISRETRDPPGGALERYRDGEPDGIIKESAQNLLDPSKVIKPPKPTPEEELDGYRQYFNRLVESGITSIGDCWVTPAKVKIYEQLVQQHFPMRFNLYIGVTYLEDLLDGKIPRIATADLRIEGVKIIHGNSFSGKTCWLYEPYDTINPATGRKDYFGIPPVSQQAALDSLVLKIHRAGLQIACHSNGDREIDMVLAAFEYAQRRCPRDDARHRIEHCSITNEEILDRLKKDSVIPVFHSYINELGNQLLVYGPPRFSRMMPMKTALDKGIHFAMHSDFPVSRFEPMKRIDGAVNRLSPSGMILGAGQRISPEEAIFAYCVTGAYTSHEENRKGRIVAGQMADLVVLEEDPVSSDPSHIKDINVTMTVVGGRIAYRR
jgi:predicted amidohydrolase YtcJ